MLPKSKKNNDKVKQENNNYIRPLSFNSRLETFRQVYLFNDEPISYQTTTTESLIPSELRSNEKKVILQSPQWLAQVGFYYTPLSLKHRFSITCSCCNQVITDPIPLDIDISNYHYLKNPLCALSAIWKFRNKINESNNNLFILQNDEFFGNVESSQAVEIRLQTFKFWNHKFPNINIMASSGLYYDPYEDNDDRVVCMYCGLRLEQWEIDDDPINVHIHENPDCWVFNFNKMNNNNNNVEELPNYDLDNNDNIVDNTNINENVDHGNDIQILSENEDDAHSVISLTTTTTTTTTAMPIEVLDRDEVEEFLQNDNINNENLKSDKMVEIPSIKSSDLSQFFTELDAESEHDTGASFFANNRKLRQEREKSKDNNSLKNKIEPIIEETHHENSINDNNNENVNDSHNISDYNPVDEDHAFENMDSINNHDIELHKNEEVIQNDIEIEKEKEKLDDKDQNVYLDNGVANNSVGKIENELSNNNKGIDHNLKESSIVTEKTESNRVQQLESELEILKKQMELLQKKNQIIQNSTKIEQQQTDDEQQQSKETSNTISNQFNQDVEDNDEPYIDENVENKTFTIEIKKHEIPSIQNSDEINSNNERKESEEYTSVKRKNEAANESNDLEENNLFNSTQLKIEKQETFDEDEKTKKTNNKTKRYIKKEEEIKKNNETDNDPLTIVSSSKKHFKKRERNKRKRQKIMEFIKKEPIEAPSIINTNIIKDNNISSKDEGVDVKIAEETTEIPTHADPINENTVEDNMFVSVKVNTNNILPNSEPEKELFSSENIVNDNNDKRDDSKHEISPTLLRKKAKTPPIISNNNNDNEITSDKKRDKVEMLNNLMNKRNAIIEETETNQIENIKDKEEIDYSNQMKTHDDNQFNESDIMLKNQSTPYINNIKDIDFNFNLNLNDKKEHITHRKENFNTITQQNKNWVPIDINKYKEFYKDINEATGYIKEILDSKYELLGDDLEGLLTEFIAEIPTEQLKMSVKEWILCQEEQAVGLVLDKADEMIEQFRKDQAKALSILENLPEI